MRLNTAVQELETNVQLHRMTVSADNPMFWRAVFDKLYSNKYRWVIEYAQNAADVDPNWRLVMPSMLHPYVQFIDNGPGMSHEFMLTGFCDAFSSTKSLSDHYTGGFGIGRLAGPNGTIFEVHHGGRKRTYAMSRDESMIPSLMELGDEPTNRTGVTVKVPVDPKNAQETEQQIKQLLRFFHPQMPEPEYQIKTPRWGLMREHGRSIAVVGGYPYEIDLEQIPSRNRTEDMNRIFAHRNNIFVVFLDVSDVDVSLSREHLDYNEKTAAALKRIAEFVSKDFPRFFTDKLKDCRTVWEARFMFERFTQNMNWALKDILQKNLTFNGKRIFESQGIQIKDQPVFVYDIRHRASRTAGLLPVKMTLDYARSTYLEYNSNSVFVLDDLESRYRLNDRIHELPVTRDTKLVFVKNEQTLKLIGDPPFIRLSEVKLPERPKEQLIRKRTTQKLFSYNHSRGVFEESTQAWPAGTVYVPMHQGLPTLKGFSALAKSSLRPNVVCGVPATSKSLICKDWVRLDDYVKAQLPDRNLAAQAVANHDFLMRNFNGSDWSLLRGLVNHLPPGHTISELVHKVDQNWAQVRNAVVHANLFNVFEIKLPERKPTLMHLLKAKEKIFRKYPALEVIASLGSGYTNKSYERIATLL